MTEVELNTMIPHQTMVYRKKDNVGYTFVGIDEQGNYELCGMPYAYEKDIIMSCFELKRT